MAQQRKKSTSQRKKQTSRRRKNAADERLSAEVRDEAALWIGLALTILFFLCNFHLIGKAGDAVSGVMFGLFGMLAYLFPLILFLGAVFIVVNIGRKSALLKEICGFVLFLTVDAFLAVIAGLDKIGSKAGEYYAYGKENTLSGGLVGGSLAQLLAKGVGVVGTVLLLLILLVVCIVVMTEKSLIGLIANSSRRIYDNVQEDMEYRRERNEELYQQREKRRAARQELQKQREEEREQRRMDQKRSGVTLDTDLTADDAKQTGKKQPAKEQPATGKGHTRRERIEPEEVSQMKEVTLEEVTQNIRITGLSEDAVPNRDEQQDDEPGSDMVRMFPEEEEEEEKTVKRRKHRIELRDAQADVYPEDPDMMQISAALEGAADEMIRGGEEEPEAAKEDAAPELTKNGREVAAPDRVESTAKPQKPPKPYKKPPVNLLMKAKNTAGGVSEREELQETALMLQQTLSTFKVNATVTDISRGPAVTRYELQPEPGVKVSKIVSLTDDLKLALAATDIRIEAPIPGKSAVGIEVPNKENTMVSLRELIESQEFTKSQSNLSFAVGKDIGGKVVTADIAKMPHVLIAGSTGSGKSVCINTLIMSILYKATPADVKLIMVDPKVVELSVYNGIPHLLLPVVTDPKKAAAALQWGVNEMMDRYKKFEDAGVRDLKGYNRKMETENDNQGQPVEKLPQIVIIVDELADLMMVAPGEVEDSICRLAQLARAAGIHLVIATQRPSVDVITGLIKANMPSRIAFAVSSGVDSRTILDMVGAEKLLGKGDMLFYPQGYPKPVRVQGAFVSDKEVADVVGFLKEHSGMEENDGENEVLKAVDQMQSGNGGSESKGFEERDAYFEDAGRFIIEKEKASIGMLQRVFKIGFNRAARIMDQLTDYGVVGEEEGTKPRKVLMTLAEFEQLLEEI